MISFVKFFVDRFRGFRFTQRQSWWFPAWNYYSPFESQSALMELKSWKQVTVHQFMRSDGKLAVNFRITVMKFGTPAHRNAGALQRQIKSKRLIFRGWGPFPRSLGMRAAFTGVFLPEKMTLRRCKVLRKVSSQSVNEADKQIRMSVTADLKMFATNCGRPKAVRKPFFR